MNKPRPAHDQLELVRDTGLLRHHCCYPNCPGFLHNHATAADVQNGTRKGIFDHLHFFGVGHLDVDWKAFHRDRTKRMIAKPLELVLQQCVQEAIRPSAAAPKELVDPKMELVLMWVQAQELLSGAPLLVHAPELHTEPPMQLQAAKFLAIRNQMIDEHAAARRTAFNLFGTEDLDDFAAQLTLLDEGRSHKVYMCLEELLLGNGGVRGAPLAPQAPRAGSIAKGGGTLTHSKLFMCATGRMYGACVCACGGVACLLEDGIGSHGKRRS
jgi:hypothetical protein